MTPEEKKAYLEAIRNQQGASLTGLEQASYRKAIESAEAAQKAREELQRLLVSVRQLEAVVPQYEGRAQACFELLLSAEEERRAAQVNPGPVVGDVTA